MCSDVFLRGDSVGGENGMFSDETFLGSNGRVFGGGGNVFMRLLEFWCEFGGDYERGKGAVQSNGSTRSWIIGDVDIGFEFCGPMVLLKGGGVIFSVIYRRI